ncbi:hypothetical protein [Spiroplasma alleghenense]|uniref:Uncharacterized protein n=1 Tax=Spiroplasma alleghenense TaxID=216931 RepID=A0A345Z3K0_9MOLU|nr:hypothetical protein [Spiroplasma alleghenense]AXK51179.1 hypothetical protein SALLE_v1c05050 [Spiroplasma alleghenense]
MNKTAKDYRFGIEKEEAESPSNSLVKYSIGQGMPTCSHEKIRLVGPPAIYGCLKCGSEFNLNGKIRFNKFRHRIVVKNIK